ncbi:MAG TPA: hypothetical protein VF772_01350, partial [Terriglobales bacterium]
MADGWPRLLLDDHQVNRTVTAVHNLVGCSSNGHRYLWLSPQVCTIRNKLPQAAGQSDNHSLEYFVGSGSNCSSTWISVS